MNELPKKQNGPSESAHKNSGHQLSIRREGPDDVRDSQESGSTDAPGTVRITSDPEQSAEPERRLLFTPPIDIFRTDEALVLRADLPGVCVDRLDLQIENNKLTLFGRVQEDLPEEAVPSHMEYQVGDFYRSFILSDEVDYERITAKMNLGVLEITLPISPQAQPRKIHVQAQ